MERQRGVLYGQAIGDALGLPAEFKSAWTIRRKWPNPLWPSNYEPTPRTGSHWEPGEYSDDTEQAVCLLDAYLEGIDNGRSPEDPIDLPSVARHFMQWAITNGRGMGNLTAQVFEHPFFLLDPKVAALDPWKRSGQQAAPNGAVMRTSYIGILRPWDLDWTENAAAEVAQVTHADPRCVASAVGLSVAIAALCDTNGDIGEAMNQATRRSSKYHKEAPKWMAGQTLSSLALDEGMDKPNSRPPIGYTYKCLGAAFWALAEFSRRPKGDHPSTKFIEVLRAVLRAGGDTDTNGAVSGALLGALVGASGIPPHLIEGLKQRSALDERFDRFAAIQSIG